MPWWQKHAVYLQYPILLPSESICSLIGLKLELHVTFFTVNKLCFSKPSGKAGYPTLLISQAKESLPSRNRSSSADLLLEKGYASEDSCHELQGQPGEQPSFMVRQERKAGKIAPMKNMPLLHVESNVNQNVLCGYNSML